MKMRRILSALMTAALLLTVFASLPLTGAAMGMDLAKIITKTNPAITANVGATVDLSLYTVEADNGKRLEPKEITWTLDGETVKTVKVEEKGVLTLTATAGEVSEKVYLVSKLPDETEYVLYENDFECTVEDLEAEGWKFLNPKLVNIEDGVMHFGSQAKDYYRAILPEWLGDFGDYAISMMANQTEVLNGSRWCSIAYRIENANKNYYPYYHMCVRANTTSSTVEFAERTTSNSWNVIYNNSHVLDMTDEGFHNLTVKAFGSTVQYLIDEESVMFVTNASAHPKGYVGIIDNYGTMNVDSIRVTVQESAPERPPVVPLLVDSSVNRGETNITNYVSTQAYLSYGDFEDYLAGEALTAAALLDLTGREISKEQFETYLKGFKEKNVIPQFRLDTKTQVDALNAALTSAKAPEAAVISADAEVVKYAREKNKTKLRGVLDLTGIKAESLTDEEIYDYYNKAAGAYAQAILVPYHLATKEYVAKWQEFELAVWAFGTRIKTAAQAAWLVASGANAVVSDNPELVAAVQTEVFTASDALTRTPVWTAHRGYSTKFPENSLAACLGGYEAGADCIEIDVHLSSDGVVMVMHDDSIDRTTNGKGKIASMTSQQLQQYKLKYKNGTLSEEHIPTFEEILQAFQGKDVKFLCEIKSGQADLPRKCVELIKKYNMENQVVFISFYANQLTSAKQYMNVTTGYLISAAGFAEENDTLNTLNNYYQKQTDTLSYHATMAINYGNLTAEFLRNANDRGLTLWTWTYSNSVAAQVCKMFLAGVNGMTTDDPQYLQDTVKTISVPTDLRVDLGDTITLSATSVTYGGTEKDVLSRSKVITLENDGVVELGDDGTVTPLKYGKAVFLLSYKTKLPNGASYTLYSQPITVSVDGHKALALKAESSYLLNRGILLSESGLTAADLLGSLASSEGVKISGKGGKSLSGTDVVGTGATVEKDGASFSICVKGDLSGNGKVSAADYLLIKRSALDGFTLSESQQAASDINGDGRVNAVDYILLKQNTLKAYGITA